MIVGEDEYSPKYRYALICEKCHRHNGLALPGESPQYVVYFCPGCNHRNGTKKPKNVQSNSLIASRSTWPAIAIMMALNLLNLIPLFFILKMMIVQNILQKKKNMILLKIKTKKAVLFMTT